jgi:hypothetical protein
VGRRAGDLLHGFSVITTLWPYYTAALSPPVIVAGTAAYASWLASSAARAPGWLVSAIIAVGIAAAGLIAWSLAARHWVPFAVAIVGGLAAVSLAPAVASVSQVAHGESAFDTPFESARAQETAVIYDTGLEALPIGGFDGTAPAPTLAQLQADVRHGLFHLVWIDSGADPRLRWIIARCPISRSGSTTACPPPRADGLLAGETRRKHGDPFFTGAKYFCPLGEIRVAEAVRQKGQRRSA